MLWENNACHFFLRLLKILRLWKTGVQIINEKMLVKITIFPFSIPLHFSQRITLFAVT